MNEFEQTSRELFSVKQELEKYKEAVDLKNDFIIWLFEESGELDGLNQHEMWDKFEVYNSVTQDTGSPVNQ